MKKLFAILGLMLTLAFTSCSSGDAGTHTNIIEGTTWKLVRVNGSFTGSTTNYTPGLIKWTFDAGTGTVTVVNGNTNPDLVDFFDTGVYDYQVIPNPDPSICSETLKIDGVEMGCFSVDNGILNISQVVVDGYALKLVP